MDKFKDAPLKVCDLNSLWKRLDSNRATERVRFQEQVLVGVLSEEEHTPSPLGALCLSVQATLSDPDKLLVYLRARFDLAGRRAASSLTCRLDRGMHTIEEKREESLEPSPGDQCQQDICKQSLFLAVQEEGLFVRHERSGREGTTENRRTYPLALGRHLVSEGANFVLMRLLAIHKFIGQFETTTLYLNGDVCKNTYCCLGPESGLVNGQRMDVCKIYRKIEESCGLTHLCTTTLTVKGRIITHEWEGCDYVIYVNPLAEMKTGLGAQMPYEKLDWCSDLQLFSLYLDRKYLWSSKTKTYLKDRPEIKHILADYVQMILQVKPDDVIDFTTEYFNRFSNH